MWRRAPPQGAFGAASCWLRFLRVGGCVHAGLNHEARALAPGTVVPVLTDWSRRSGGPMASASREETRICRLPRAQRRPSLASRRRDRPADRATRANRAPGTAAGEDRCLKTGGHMIGAIIRSIVTGFSGWLRCEARTRWASLPRWRSASPRGRRLADPHRAARNRRQGHFRLWATCRVDHRRDDPAAVDRRPGLGQPSREVGQARRCYRVLVHRCRGRRSVREAPDARECMGIAKPPRSEDPHAHTDGHRGPAWIRAQPRRGRGQCPGGLPHVGQVGTP